ncbi:MAG: putative toxin-antitoxin system toxin component, PIN family [Syntrophobacteraceae bacterium]|jgi:putative PIN family toxin of toxin-antitoxin system
MIRVVLDTNILVSAILSPRGLAARILGYEREDKIELAFSPDTTKEIFLVLRSSKIKALLKKRAVSLQKVESFLKTLMKSSVRTAGSVEVARIKDDPSDNMFLACALEAEADFIVSDDVHLNKLKAFHGIQIVDTLIFLKVMGQMG